MTVDVDRNRTDRAVLHFVVESSRGRQLIELATALGDLEPFVVDLLEAVIAREIVGAIAGEKDVRPFVQQAAGEADRCARGPKTRYVSCGEGAAVHDRVVELESAGGRQSSSAFGG